MLLSWLLLALIHRWGNWDFQPFGQNKKSYDDIPWVCVNRFLSLWLLFLLLHCFLDGVSQYISIVIWYYSSWAEEIPNSSSFSYVKSYSLSGGGVCFGTHLLFFLSWKPLLSTPLWTNSGAQTVYPLQWPETTVSPSFGHMYYPLSNLV